MKYKKHFIKLFPFLSIIALSTSCVLVVSNCSKSQDNNNANNDNNNNTGNDNNNTNNDNSNDTGNSGDSNDTNDKPLPDPILPPEQPIDPSVLPQGWWIKSNTTPEAVNQFPINHTKPLHFNYPYYDSTGKYVTLRADGEPVHNYPSPGVPSGPNQYAQEGYIATEKHVQLAKQVFSVGFHTGVEKTGTCWILDYKLTNNGSYPLTWYFGTNAHVLDDLKVADDKLYPEKFGQWSEKNKEYRCHNTTGVSLWRLKDPKVGEIDKEESNVSPDWGETLISFYDRSKENWDTGEIYKGYYLDKTPIKIIFTGNDFLTTSPKDDSTNSYSNREEYADFAVFELTFENEEQAKTATNNYANWKEEEKFKYHETDLVKNPSLQTDIVYEVGYPQTYGGYTAHRTVAINYNEQRYKAGIKNETNGLSSSINYNTWTGRPGKYDGHIAMPFFGYNYEWVDNSIDYDKNNPPIKTTPYATYGLIYGTDNGNMAPGSSGALVVDDNGYAIGIHFASDNNAATGSAQAFYCSGYDYKGYYGKYNLPQYDLIRGGYPKQKNSYYDGLTKLYGKDPNFKTRLFPNGLVSRR